MSYRHEGKLKIEKSLEYAQFNEESVRNRTSRKKLCKVTGDVHDFIVPKPYRSYDCHIISYCLECLCGKRKWRFFFFKFRKESIMIGNGRAMCEKHGLFHGKDCRACCVGLPPFVWRLSA